MSQTPSCSAVINAYSEGSYAEIWKTRETTLNLVEARLVEEYCPSHESHILTAGCGMGRETFALYNLGYRNIRGLDCTESLIQLARQHNLHEGLDIPYDVASLESMPYDDESFDVVTLFANLYGHILPRSSRVQSLREVGRILKPKGRALVIANNIYHSFLAHLYVRFGDCCRLFYNPRRMEWGDKVTREGLYTSHWFTAKELREEAREAGLSVPLITSSEAFIKAPKQNTTKFHRQGCLLSVLEKTM